MCASRACALHSTLVIVVRLNRTVLDGFRGPVYKADSGLRPRAGAGWPEAGTRTRVLVVDDESLIRRLAHRMLAMAGFEVYEAGSVNDALGVLREHPNVDILLTDIGLPDGLGSKLAETVADISPETVTQFMSGDTREYLVRSGRIPPSADLLQKPFRYEELLESVRRALVKER